MSEPMVSHDCVAFYLLSEEVARAGQGRAVGAGRRRDLRRLRLVPAAGGRAARRTRSTPYADGLLRPRPHDDGAMLAPGVAAPTTDVSRRLRRRALRGARRRRPRSTRRCASTRQIMLVDDPVKRVDNMTMAWGLEARVPFLDHELVELAARLPARAEARRRRQGRAEGRRARPRAGRGDRPAEGLLPGPGDPAPRGSAAANACATRCTTPRPARRGLFRPDASCERLLADPNAERTTLGSNVAVAARAARAVAAAARARLR